MSAIPSRRGLWLIAGALGALLTLLAPSAIGGPALRGLLQTLDLADYAPGERPPDFSGLTVDGRTVSLAGLRGKVVLVNFWATWCLECRHELPAFERLHREFARQGLTVMGINAREGREVIRRYAKELGLSFPLVLDPNGEINAMYGVIGLPTTFLIGRDGRAVARAIGPREWESAHARTIVQALLSEPAARTGAP